MTPYVKVSLLVIVLLFASCSSTEKLTYLNNLQETSEVQYFEMDQPDYIIQPRDIIYISIKTIMPDGSLEDMLQPQSNYNTNAYLNTEAAQFISGYNVDERGKILMPGFGFIDVEGNTIYELQKDLQELADKKFKDAYVECKLLSFKFTVLGEAKVPGTYINYNNYLTVLEAIGRAGGVSDFGRRDRVIVLRPTSSGTSTYRVNLQDKNLLSSEAYFLQPNDLVIIEPVKHKIFNMNLPTFSFIVATITSTITTTLLLVNFFNTN